MSHWLILIHILCIYVSKSSWHINSMFSLPQPMGEMIYAKHNGSLFIFGGEIGTSTEWGDHILIYNPVSFTRINESQPDSTMHSCGAKCTASFNDIIYIIPNMLNQDTRVATGIIWTFNVLTKTYITHSIPTMPHPVYAACIAEDYIHNILYLIGGTEGKGGQAQGSWDRTLLSTQIQALMIDTNQWLALNNFEQSPIAFQETSCEYFNDKIFVFGGINRIYDDYYNENAARYDHIYKYHITSDIWIKLNTKLSSPRHFHSTVLSTVNNMIYIIGGVNWDIIIKTVEVFDPETETMQQSYHDVIFGAIIGGLIELDNRLYWFGGQASGSKLDHIEVSSVISLNPTNSPTNNPTTHTNQPTSTPTGNPTLSPTNNTHVPTLHPTQKPSAFPTLTPTDIPTLTPTDIPTSTPTNIPTLTPTDIPTAKPTTNPTLIPTNIPTLTPTNIPTLTPTNVPTTTPTVNPTLSPTSYPSAAPILNPTAAPSNKPTYDPTNTQTYDPTNMSTHFSSSNPSNKPSTSPTQITTITGRNKYHETKQTTETEDTNVIWWPIFLGVIGGILVLAIVGFLLLKYNNIYQGYNRTSDDDHDMEAMTGK